MWDGNIAALRFEYLFALGNLCSVSAAQSWDLTVIEFGVLLRDIDAYLAARKAEG